MIDLFVILILHSVTNKRKVVESLLRSKVRSGSFGEDVLKTAFISHGQVGNGVTYQIFMSVVLISPLTQQLYKQNRLMSK